MKRGFVVLLIFVAGTAAGGLVVWALTRDSGSGTHVSSSKSPKPSVTASGKELIDRLNAGEKATFHVRYSYGNESSGARLVLEVWHTGTKVRRDITAISATEGSTHTEEFLDQQTFTRCLQLEAQPWQCTAAPLQASTLQDPVGGANHDVNGATVTVTDDTNAGHAVRCYTVAPPNATAKPSQFCLSSENVPLRIDGGDGKPVNATNYDLTVPDNVFTHPAPLTGTNAA